MGGGFPQDTEMAAAGGLWGELVRLLPGPEASCELLTQNNEGGFPEPLRCADFALAR